MKIIIPENVKEIIDKLLRAGYTAYAVGGCIRDSVMGNIPHDWDICTSAVPEEILSVLGKHNVIESGLKHGTVTVHYGKELYEITTYRMDGDYLDNRRPESVKFITSLKEDLSRRDFTINAMAYNDSDGLCDYFGGTEDIKNKVIRCVGDADERFQEDALRILRALRFASRLGFEIEEKTKAALKRRAELLKNISSERIASELLQIIDGEYAESVLLEYTDVFGIFMPEILPCVGFMQNNPHHIYDVWKHTVKVIVNCPHDKALRIAALLHDIAKPECATTDEKGIGHFHGHPEKSAVIAEKILKRLHFDNDTIKKTVLLIRYHDLRPQPEPKYVRRLISEVGADHFLSLMELKRADARGQNPETIDYKLKYVNSLEKLYYQLTADGTEYNVKTLKIKGKDLIELGIKEGKDIGRILNAMLKLVIDGEIDNDREKLIENAKKYIQAMSGTN